MFGKLAPSGRELPTESGEGACVTILLTRALCYVGSFHRKRSPSLSEGGKYAAMPIYLPPINPNLVLLY